MVGSFGIVLVVIVMLLSVSRCILLEAATQTEVDMHFDKNINTQDNGYYCTALPIRYDQAYIVQMEPHLNTRGGSHHMLLFGCMNVFDRRSDSLETTTWSCDRNAVCNDMTILFGWDASAQPVQLPTQMDGVFGLALRISLLRPKYIVGIHIMFASDQKIPAQQKNYSVDINCHLRQREPVIAFAYRVHTHHYGQQVAAYRVQYVSAAAVSSLPGAKTHMQPIWTTLAVGNPHKPQAFYNMPEAVELQPKDILAAKCFYDTRSTNVSVFLGREASKEMCNLYLMYYTDAVSGYTSSHCENVEIDDLVMDNSVLPTNPPPLRFQQANVWRTVDESQPLGQVVAVTIDIDGNVLLFHRGRRVWSQLSFDNMNMFLQRDRGPIKEATIVKIDDISTHVIHQWGNDMFYMPHGLSVDINGSLWVTDVALHQILKLRRNGDELVVELILGEAFNPGGDNRHFCKPTSVAVTTAGDFYVADGYCNARVMHFDANGVYLDEWGQYSGQMPLTLRPGYFNIPHKVVVIEDSNMVCVADRENGRVQCFTLSGQRQVQMVIDHDGFRGQLYSIAAHKGLLYAISGPKHISNPSQGFVFNITTQELVGNFAPIDESSFTTPHDVASDGTNVLVAEIGPNCLWRFIQDEHKSRKKVLEHYDVGKEEGVGKHYSSSVAPSVAVVAAEGDVTELLSSHLNANSIMLIVIVIMSLPLLAVALLFALVQARRHGWLRHSPVQMKRNGTSGSHRAFDLDVLLPAGRRHKGFDRVALEEPLDQRASDDDDEDNSDVEEFNAARKA